MITTSIGASRGGQTSPLSSECVITKPPTMRVDTPHDVFHANAVSPFSSWNLRSNALAKFCPRLCEVPACSALLSCIIASHEYVRTAPANFSLSLLRPVITGIAIHPSMNSR